MPFPLPKGKPEFSKLEEIIFQKGIIIGFVLLSAYFLVSCSRTQSADTSLVISSCNQLAEHIGDFQTYCQTDSDCIRVEDPGTFCYSETIHINKKNEYDTLFKKLGCPVHKPGQSDRGDYCETDTKSNNYCNISNGMCTTGNKN